MKVIAAQADGGGVNLANNAPKERRNPQTYTNK
jgi:hypothetical protein